MKYFLCNVSCYELDWVYKVLFVLGLFINMIGGNFVPFDEIL